MSDIFLAGQTLPAGLLNGFAQAGSVFVNLVSAIAGNADITFPAPFDGTPPHLTATVTHATFSGAAAVYAARCGNLTTTGATVRILRVDSSTPITASIEVHWIALGRPA